MKTLLLILLCIPMMSFGQTHTIDDYNITLTDDASVSDFYQNTYYNALDAVEISWQIITDSMPNNWDFSICFPMCTAIGVANGSGNFNPNTQQYLNCHFYPNNTPGTGVLRMEITTNQNYIDTVTWTGIATSSLNIQNIDISQNKVLIKTIDLLGRETPFKPNTPLIYIYDDGTVEKKMTLK
jgi:hypothetical protein